MRGWCPVDDRIVDGRNGVCPECGTPLVDLTARPRETGEERFVIEEDAPDPEPAAESTALAESKLWPEIRLPERFFGRGAIALGPVAIAGIVLVSVLASFLVGLAIPRGRGEAFVEPLPPVRARYTDPAVRHGAGLGLRLESFSQDGFHVTVRVTLPEAAHVGVGRIQSIELTPFVADDEAASAAFSLEARPTVSATGVPGFVAEGNLPAIEPSTKVTGIRIESLVFSSQEGVDIPLDLSGLAPGTSGVPRAKALRSGDGSATFRHYVLQNVVGWPDRLELRMDVTSDRDESWYADEAFSLVQPNTEPLDGFVSGDAPPHVHVVFPVAPPWSKRATLRVTVRGITVGGHWEWQLA